jgi:conjugal transfer pilus assembly protein TrbC
MIKKNLMTLAFYFSLLSASFAWNNHAPTSNVLIFVSFSMPKESLRGWLREANLIKAPVIIRGLVHQSFRETTNAVMGILPNERGGVQLDPLLFRRFHIEKVPAVLVARTDCLRDETCHEFDVVYGDVTLNYALKTIADRSDAVSPYAELARKELQIQLKEKHT